MFKQQRLDKMKHVKLYPHLSASFKPTYSLDKFRENYNYLDSNSTSDDTISLCGIITSCRDYGKKLKFVDIERNGVSVQFKLARENFSSPEEFRQISDLLHRGDKIGKLIDVCKMNCHNGYSCKFYVTGGVGRPARTKTGELSLAVSSVQILAPCLRNLPTTNFDLSYKRYKRRYLDFMINAKSRNVLEMRAKVIKYLRKFLEDRDFLEVETPILGDNVGGANARPFLTWHNDMGRQLSMRIAPELYLKQLIIGGFDKVFEIGKLFRNEGVDLNHNPEFTSCEFYHAYADYHDLIELTEELLCGMVQSLNLQPQNLQFNRPFEKIEFIPSLESATNKTFPSPDQIHSEESKQFLISLCKESDIDLDKIVTVPRLLDKLIGKLVEPELKQPTFLLHHPLIMSPLAKEHRSITGLSERFELFIDGKEVANAYTELNDPELQRQALQLQAGSSDPEAMLPDDSYCTALEYGLPPTAGWGAGIDRLVMVLTDTKSIRDVITFPLS